MQYSIKKFDVQSMRKNRAVLFIGGSGTGKSTAMTSVLYHNRDIPAGICLSGTEEGDPHFRNFMPDIFIYNGWDPEPIERLLESQQKKKRQIEGIQTNINYCRENGRHRDVDELEKRYRREEKAMAKFVIIDDCMYNASITRSSTLRRLFFNGRHYGVLVLLSCQYAMNVDISLRGNCGYVFICREPIVSYRKKIYESFVGMLPSFAIFEQCMNACTQNFEQLVVDRTSRSTNPEDNIFWFKAEPSYKFRIGSERIWAFHRAHYDKDHEDRLAKERRAKRVNGIVSKRK